MGGRVVSRVPEHKYNHQTKHAGHRGSVALHTSAQAARAAEPTMIESLGPRRTPRRTPRSVDGQ